MVGFFVVYLFCYKNRASIQKMSRNIIFNFHSESLISRLLGLSAGLIVLFLAISSILSWNILGFSTGLVLLSILFFFAYNKLISKVVFYEDYIEAKYLFKVKKIGITSISKVYKNQEGLIPAYVFVLVYQENGKNKKITFYCEEEEFKKAVSPWLVNKDISVSK